MPIRSRNKGTIAHLANARVALGVDVTTVLAFVLMAVCFVAMLVLLDAFR